MVALHYSKEHLRKHKLNYEQIIDIAQRILIDNPEANISEQDRTLAKDYLAGLANIYQELIDFEEVLI
jgi:hypothetical protein